MLMSRKGVLALSKLFNIRPAEWPRLLLLYLMYFVFVTGSIWAEISLEAAFINQMQGALAGFLVVKAVASILAFALYSAFADRVANDKLLIAFLIVTGLVISGGLGLLVLGIVVIAYPLLYLLIFVPLDELFVAHWYTYVNDFYDTRSAKRIVPVLSTAGRVAGVFGGLTISTLNALLPSTAGIIVIWLLTLFIMGLLAWLMPRLLKKVSSRSEQADPITPQATPGSTRQPDSYFSNLREGYHYVAQSTFLRWLALSTFVLIMLLAFVQFKTWAILGLEYQTEAEISNFLGQVIWITNLIVLPFQLFLLSRIIGRAGVGNANLIFPSGLFAICSSLLLWAQPFTAGLAHFGRTNFYGAIGYPIDSLLYNAVPLRIKGRARAFIGGLVGPTGTLIGGLLLLTPLVGLNWFVSLFIGVFATLFLVTSLIVRRQYGQALVEMLEQEDFSFLLSQAGSSLIATDPATLNRLRQKLNESDSYEFTIFMAQLISQIGGQDAVPILGQVVRDAADAHSRAGLLEVLVAADTQGEAVRQLYTDFLTDTDGHVRQTALTGLAQLTEANDEQFLSLALDMLSDSNPDVGVLALTGLAHADNFYELPPAVEMLNQLLADQDPHRRTQGVQILGRLTQQQATRKPIDSLRPSQQLIEYLKDPDDEVRLETAVMIETLSKISLPDRAVELIAAPMLALLEDPVARVRQAALVVLGRLGGRQAYQTIVKALTDPSSQVEEEAVEVLAGIGKSVIPIVHPQLDATDLQLRKMAAIVLARINPRQYGGIIQTHITGNLLTIYQNYGYIQALSCCTQFPSISVLQNVLEEQNKRLRDEIFYILTALHDPEAIKVVTDSLQSDNPRIRANAGEALESLTSPQTTQLIVPLFEPEQSLSKLIAVSQENWDMEHPDSTLAIKKLATNPDTPWLRIILTYALGEMGITLSSNGTNADDDSLQLEPETDTAAAAPADPLEALAGVAQRSRRKKRRPKPVDLLKLLGNDNDNGDQDEAIQPDEPAEKSTMPSVPPMPLTLAELEELLETSAADPVEDVRHAALTAKRMLAGFDIIEEAKKEEILLSTVEKIIFLKQVPFFKGMTIHQLEVLANICEEELFEEDSWIFHQNDPGGVLYVVVSGKVGIEREKRKGSYARLATLGAYHYFGEMTLLDTGPRSAAAIALQDTLTLSLRREPLIALARQYPDVSLELIQILSERLRDANNRIAELTRSRPREIQKLFDTLE